MSFAPGPEAPAVRVPVSWGNFNPELFILASGIPQGYSPDPGLFSI